MKSKIKKSKDMKGEKTNGKKWSEYSRIHIEQKKRHTFNFICTQWSKWVYL